LLDDAAIERYARQIVVPGIGAAGQEKLLESTVLLVGHPRGCATAALYLRAAGVNVA
jgi:molybdopterin/thiamine biosynthesis adenylyltransferase